MDASHRPMLSVPSNLCQNHPQIVDSDRFLTPRECARMQGFPDWFALHSLRAHHQLGNSVSPPLVALLASHLTAHVTHHRATASAPPDPLWLPGWSAAARLALQGTADPAVLASRGVTFPDGSITTIGALAAQCAPHRLAQAAAQRACSA
eukprot:TRINITY_DN10461_c0_g1_i1.p1 TRINITY_DN10461_c0_g1~~TRINITY_DN10461_c0_g1_i1.p1  ORF type:complete len:150 (+),score=14.21 TRINITY_DN10461_c0_g1_i1:80-529(+)